MRIVLSFFLVFCVMNLSGQENPFVFEKISDTQSFFENKPPIISGHRGGAAKGFPENSIATMERTLEHTPAIFEVDVRLTKDGEVVLLHDATLERTTTGTGRVKDHNLAELQGLVLKDTEGNSTPYPIPTLEEAILWSKGKTILNLDVKDVPAEKKVSLVKKHAAFPHVIFTIHSPEQGELFYQYDQRSMFSAFIKTKEDFEKYNRSLVPWSNILIAYVGPESKRDNRELYDLLREKGVSIMVSAATSYDRLESAQERAEAYRKVVLDGAQVLESDLPIEAAAAVKSLQK